MSGRILVIDSDLDRKRVLVGALTAAYFEVVDAPTPPDGPAPDLVVLGREDAGGLARAIADLPPKALVLTMSDPGSISAGEAFRAGADDHLAWPASPEVLLARMRNLIRGRMMTDELALRQKTARDLGLEPESEEPAAPDSAPRILLIAPAGAAANALRRALGSLTGADIALAPSGFAAMRVLERGRPDVVIVAERAGAFGGGAGLAESEDAVSIIGALRSRTEARDAAIIHLSSPPASDARTRTAWSRRLAAAFEAGATDSAPVEPNELAARLAIRLRAKRRDDALRAWLDGGLRQAAVDAMTGLHNRRYFDLHFARIFAGAQESGARLAALVFDIDRFKAVNDAYGHGTGDEALRAFAMRLRDGFRGADLVARLGGEEFAVILRNAAATEAQAAAERVRAAISGAPIASATGDPVRITVSVGVASLFAGDKTPEDLLGRADAALRAAKRGGRDRVRVDAA